MQDIATERQLGKDLRIVWLIWFGMFASLIVYLVLALYFGDMLQTYQNEAFPLTLLKNILSGVAAVELILIFILRKLLLKTVGAGSPIGKYTSVVIICLALAESIAIYGLVLFMLGANIQTFGVFLIISAVAMIWHRPQTDEYRQLVNPDA